MAKSEWEQSEELLNTKRRWMWCEGVISLLPDWDLNQNVQYLIVQSYEIALWIYLLNNDVGSVVPLMPSVGRSPFCFDTRSEEL